MVESLPVISETAVIKLQVSGSIPVRGILASPFQSILASHSLATGLLASLLLATELLASLLPASDVFKL